MNIVSLSLSLSSPLSLPLHMHTCSLSPSILRNHVHRIWMNMHIAIDSCSLQEHEIYFFPLSLCSTWAHLSLFSLFLWIIEANDEREGTRKKRVQLNVQLIRFIMSEWQWPSGMRKKEEKRVSYCSLCCVLYWWVHVNIVVSVNGSHFMHAFFNAPIVMTER